MSPLCRPRSKTKPSSQHSAARTSKVSYTIRSAPPSNRRNSGKLCQMKDYIDRHFLQVDMHFHLSPFPYRRLQSSCNVSKHVQRANAAFPAGSGRRKCSRWNLLISHWSVAPSPTRRVGKPSSLLHACAWCHGGRSVDRLTRVTDRNNKWSATRENKSPSRRSFS